MKSARLSILIFAATALGVLPAVAEAAQAGAACFVTNGAVEAPVPAELWAVMTRASRSKDCPAHFDGATILENVRGAWSPESLAQKALPGGVLEFEELRVLHYYVSAGFDALNQALRQGGEAAECMRPLREALERVLMRFPEAKGKTLWRGLSFSPDDRAKFLEAHPAGSTIEFAAFTSTSESSEVAERFSRTPGREAGLIFMMESQSCRDISLFNALEKEVICLPGTRFKILGVDHSGLFVLSEIPRHSERKAP